jgi:hypothetical protein
VADEVATEDEASASGPAPGSPRAARGHPGWKRLGEFLWRRKARVAVVAFSLVSLAVTGFVTKATEIGTERFFGKGPTATSATAPGDPSGRGFQIAVDLVYREGQAFALPRAVTSGKYAAQLLAGFPDLQHDMTAFLRDTMGQAQRSLTAKIVFTGTVDRPARIIGLRVQKTRTAPNLSGTAIRTSSAGEPGTIPLTVELDHATPRVLSHGKPYFPGHDIEVTRNIRETFAAQFIAARHSYRWVIAVDYVTAAGATDTVYVDTLGRLYGRPDQVSAAYQFGLTGPAPSYRVVYADNYPSDLPGFHIVKPTP